MPQPRTPSRRFIAPHPLVTLGGIAGVFLMWLIGRRTNFQPAYIWITIGVSFAVLFSAISRRSARREAARRDREMEELRRKRVFGLDEE